MMKLKFQPEKMNFKFEFSVLSYFALVLIIMPAPLVIESVVNDKLTFGYIFEIIVWPMSYVLFNALIFSIMKTKLIRRGIIMVISGMAISFIKVYKSPGIIDPVYFFLASSFCTLTIGFYKAEYLYKQLNSISYLNPANMKLIEYLRDMFKYLLGKFVQGLLAFAASVGISMTILFRSGWDDPQLALTGIKMLLGFIGISIGVTYWTAIPLFNGIFESQEKMGLLIKLKDDEPE